MSGIVGSTFPTTMEGRLVQGHQDLARQIAQLQRTAGWIGPGSIVGTEHIRAGTVTAGAIAAGTITGDLIAGQAIQAVHIASGTITAGNIAAGTITGILIAGRTIAGDRMLADTITAGEIAASAITTAELAALAITTEKLAANSVTSEKIVAGTIVASDIAATTITGALIAAGTITATNVATGTLTGALLAGATITGDKLVADTITSREIVGTTLAAISADLGTVTAGRLVVGALGGAKAAVGSAIPTSVGDRAGVVGTDAAGAVTFALDSATGNLELKGHVLSGSTGLGNIGGQIHGTSNVAPATIAGDRLVVDAITAREIAAASITGVEIATRTLTAGHVQLATLTGAEIAAGSIQADRLNVGVLSAITANLGNVTAGTLTGALIRTAATGARLELDPAGLRSLDAAGATLIRLPTDGSDSLFTGRIEARGVTARGDIGVPGEAFVNGVSSIGWIYPDGGSASGAMAQLSASDLGGALSGIYAQVSGDYLPAPSSITFSTTTRAGSSDWPAGTYRIFVTAIDGRGESLPGPGVDVTIAEQANMEQWISTIDWATITGATGYRVYLRRPDGVTVLYGTPQHSVLYVNDPVPSPLDRPIASPPTIGNARRAVTRKILDGDGFSDFDRRPHWAEHGAGELFLPNSGAHVSMRRANGNTLTLGLLGEPDPIEWIIKAKLLVRSDSANDCTVRARIIANGVEIAASFAQRLYWGSGSLSGRTTIYLMGRLMQPANVTRDVRVEVKAESPIGGFAYAGGATHNNFYAERVRFAQIVR